MMETPLITYNLTDRGRKFRGKERNFHLKKMADAINSPETQERVAHRDMLGYYGHWARIRFGMNPNEGDAVQIVEPALVTTFLKASDDGTIQHKAEFLGTKAGQIAEQLFNNRTGGFSSAIDEGKPEFFGFDFVLEPNYSTNRGYELTLDSITGKLQVQGMSIEDIINAEYNDQLSGALALVNNLKSANSLALDSLSHLQEENEELLSLLSARSALDSTTGTSFSSSKLPAQRLFDDMAFFKASSLPSFAEPQAQSSVAENRFYKRLRNGY